MVRDFMSASFLFLQPALNHNNTVWWLGGETLTKTKQTNQNLITVHCSDFNC